MEKKYINEARYKRGTSRKRRDATTVKSNLNTKKGPSVSNVKNKKNTKKVKRKIKKIEDKKRTSNIIYCIILIIIIAIVSRAILKDENEPFIPFLFSNESNEQIVKIGVITDENLMNTNNRNLLINELKKYSSDMLLQINEDYSITYKCISNVVKISNREYVLSRNVESKVTVNSIKEALDKYRLDKDSVYYYKLKNIDSVIIIDNNTLNIKLKEDMPYFIYNLDISLNTSVDLTNYVQHSSSSAQRLVYKRHEDADEQLPAEVLIIRYADMYNAVNAYKNKEINMFVTNAENVENILGKYEYNIKKYRNGKNVFLLINSKSDMCSRDEVRKAVAYGIDRDSIINDILKSKGDKIDLPYIYDIVKYKYDVYAAENLLLTSEYKKSNNVYSKVENGIKRNIQLKLVVNKDDKSKVEIASIIKNNLKSIGIIVNVEKLTESKLKSTIKNKDYDLAIANIDLNNVPDISFVSESLLLTDNIKIAIENANNSDINEMEKNIMKLQTALSNDISIIGLYSDVSYLVYSKDIVDVDNISYMNVFKELLS